ncbi:hypothetical protein LSAT2_032451 [Lamellibrachia satsuma]|nr:hypothetical protein LSAT2_032451 [Lamellibrachia satsuma]
MTVAAGLRPSWFKTEHSSSITQSWKGTKQQRERQRIHKRSRRSHPTMTDVMKVVCRCIMSEQPWCPFLQSCLLALTAMLVVATLPSTHGDCPAVDPHCYCSSGSIYCNNIGVISKVPPFSRSNTTYHRLKIIGETTLSTLQAGAFEGIKVTRIILSHLGITTIKPGAFSGLGNILEMLNLTYNQLEIITDETFNGLNKITKLHLSNNWLTTVTDGGFDGLNKLMYLYMDNNRLETMSAAWFRQLTQLDHLNLQRNQLRTIPYDVFDGLSQLTRLDLSSNRMKTVNAAWFSQLTQLEYLRLSDNQLETIPRDAFDGFNKLTSLSLSSNRLVTLNAAWFSKLQNLKSLYLAYNRLEMIPDNAFYGLKELKYLYLDNNRLTTVSSALFRSISYLKDMSIQRNRLVCNCGLAWLRKKANILYDNPLCSSPPALEGSPVVSYDISLCSVTSTETVSTTAASSADVVTTVNRRSYAPTSFQTSSTSTYGTNIDGSDKDNTEHFALIAVGILSGLLAVALVISIFIRTRRQHSVKDRAVDTEDDPCIHTTKELRDMTKPVYETAAVPETTST